jgi:hypothetical protein
MYSWLSLSRIIRKRKILSFTIKQIIDELGSSDEGLTIEDDDAANLYGGISTLHELWQNFTYPTYYIKNYSINKKNRNFNPYFSSNSCGLEFNFMVLPILHDTTF